MCRLKPIVRCARRYIEGVLSGTEVSNAGQSGHSYKINGSGAGGCASNCGFPSVISKQSDFCPTNAWRKIGSSAPRSNIPECRRAMPASLRTTGSGEPHLRQKFLRYAGGSCKIGASYEEIKSGLPTHSKFSAEAAISGENMPPVALRHRVAWQA